MAPIGGVCSLARSYGSQQWPGPKSLGREKRSPGRIPRVSAGVFAKTRGTTTPPKHQDRLYFSGAEVRKPSRVSARARGCRVPSRIRSSCVFLSRPGRVDYPSVGAIWYVLCISTSDATKNSIGYLIVVPKQAARRKTSAALIGHEVP
jgi:hypothetical protein